MKKHLLLAALAIYAITGIASPSEAQAQKTAQVQTAVDGNKIYACYHKNTGQLRKVDGTGQCKSAEIELSWNIVGPQGDPGPQGPQGPKGDMGPAGPQGPSGEGLSDHHQELRFSLGVTETRTFPLPRHDFPVTIEVSTSNVPVTFSGTTISLGPSMTTAVVSFDSTAGVANITDGAMCPGHDSCEFAVGNNLPEPNFYTGGVQLVLRLDRHTGDITVSLRAVGPVTISASQIDYAVSMWY